MKLTKGERKWFGRILYALFLIVVCEISLRVYLVHFADTSNFERYASWKMLENRFKEPQIVPHLYLRHVNNAKYDYRFNKHNSFGFRGEEILIEKRESSYRIVCIGGSTTYGTGVFDYKQSYPYLLQEALQKKGIDAEVINAGVEGYNSLQSYINYVLKVEPLEPDMLIVYHAVNDVWTRIVWPPEAYVVDQSGSFVPLEYSVYNLLRKLSIVRIPLVYAKVIAPDVALTSTMNVPETNYFLELRAQLQNDTYPSGVFESVPLDSMINTNKPIFFRKNIDRLVREAISRGTEVVLCTFVYSAQFPEYFPEMKTSGFQRSISEHNEILRELGRKHNAPLLDLENEFVVKKDWFTDGIHFNYKGNQRLVEEITDSLIPMFNK